MDRVRNEEVRRRARIERELASRADQRVLRLFEHVERTQEYRMARRVMAEVSGGRVRYRRRLRWMDVKFMMGNTGITAERKILKSGESWSICNWLSFTQPFLLGPVLFRTALPCSGGYYLKRGGMLLNDAVGLNCKRVQQLKIKAQVPSIWVQRCMLDDCVRYLIWHDYPSVVEGKIMVYSIINKKKAWSLLNELYRT